MKQDYKTVTQIELLPLKSHLEWTRMVHLLLCGAMELLFSSGYVVSGIKLLSRDSIHSSPVCKVHTQSKSLLWSSHEDDLSLSSSNEEKMIDLMAIQNS